MKNESFIFFTISYEINKFKSANNFKYWFPQKTNIIQWNYIKNTTIYQSFIEIKWPVDFRKDPII